MCARLAIPRRCAEEPGRIEAAKTARVLRGPSKSDKNGRHARRDPKDRGSPGESPRDPCRNRIAPGGIAGAAESRFQLRRTGTFPRTESCFHWDTAWPRAANLPEGVHKTLWTRTMNGI